jgi:hypothetical protein
MGMAVTQCSIKKDLKVVGETGVDAMMSELNHLHVRKALKPKTATDLTKEARKKRSPVTPHVPQTEEMRRDQGMGSADRRKQREHTPKDSATSPTGVVIEHVILLCIGRHPGCLANCWCASTQNCIRNMCNS